jgi:hypothetical protein
VIRTNYYPSRIHVRGGERILGDSNFVKQVLDAHNEKLEDRYRLQSKGINFVRAAQLVEETCGIPIKELRRGDKRPGSVKARREIVGQVVNYKIDMNLVGGEKV